jgi:hypothetical protein
MACHDHRPRSSCAGNNVPWSAAGTPGQAAIYLAQHDCRSPSPSVGPTSRACRIPRRADRGRSPSRCSAAPNCGLDGSDHLDGVKSEHTPTTSSVSCHVSGCSASSAPIRRPPGARDRAR